jgi:hypothetical protein
VSPSATNSGRSTALLADGTVNAASAMKLAAALSRQNRLAPEPM